MAELPITLEKLWFSSTSRTTGPCCADPGVGVGVGDGVGPGAGVGVGVGAGGGPDEFCEATPGEDGVDA